MIKNIIVIGLSLIASLLFLYIVPQFLGLLDYNLYIIYGFIFALVSFWAVIQIRSRFRDMSIAPSYFVILLFLVIPPVGSFGYSVIIKLVGSYLGGRLSFDYPIYLWYLGTMIFSISVLISNIFFSRRPKVARYIWDFSMLKGFMYFFILVSALFTIIAIYKIGYIPMLKGNFDIDRFSYDVMVGEYIIKFSRLWLVVFIIAVHLYFFEYKKLYFVIMAVSSFFLIMYGNRTYLFMPIAYLLLFYIKHKKTIKLRVLIVAIFTSLALFYFLYQVRTESVSEFQKASVVGRVAPFIFGEWRDFSYTINDFHKTGNPFLKERIFIGVISPILPKQVWRLFGVDKDKMFSKNAAEYFGRYFGHYAGIRIGTIGECYIGFGMTGIIMIMAFLGFIFSFIENRYMVLGRDDPRFMFVLFTLSIFIFLPLLTFINITATLVFFGFFIYLSMFFCKKVRVA